MAESAQATVDAFLDEASSSVSELAGAESSVTATDATSAAASGAETSGESRSLASLSTSDVVDARALLREVGAATAARASELMRVDLGLLTVRNTQAFEPNSMRSGKARTTTMRRRGQAAVQVMFNELFRLPSERAINGAVVQLPAARDPLPREKPLPEKKPETRWEKYAKMKGIKKTKKSRFEWDEAKQEWRPRSGYQKANDEMQDWVIEDTAGKSIADPSYDPFMEREAAKKERVEKQRSREERNLARADAELAKAKGVAPSGRAKKSRLGAVISLDADAAQRTVARAKKARRDGGAGSGGGGGGDAAPERASRGERIAELAVVTNAVQTSTASLGVFDKKLKSLGERSVRGKRKRFEPLVAAAAGDEKARNLKILRRVVHKDSDDAHVDVDKAVKRQRRLDQITGRQTGAAPKTVRDTARRSKQSKLPQTRVAGASAGVNANKQRRKK